MTASNTPRIRFKEFDGIWQSKRLDEIVQFMDELRRPLKASERKPGPYPYYGASGIIDHIDDYLFSDELILLSEDGANILNRSSPICFIAQGKYWVNNHAHVLKSKSERCELFIRDALERLRFEKYNTGTAQPKLNQDVCRKISLKIADPDEQRKIGEYFGALDRTIELHKCKLQKLLALKFAMLQRMFPLLGMGSPDVRFKGFSKKWTSGPVSLLLKERNTQAPKSEEYPLMAFVAGRGVAPKGERYNREFLVVDEENKKYKQTELGDFIYSSNNLETGSIGLNKFGSASISPVYSVFSPTPAGRSEFIGQLLCQAAFVQKMIKWRQGVVYGQWRIHESNFLSINISFPDIEEQNKIGDFFRGVDELISKQQIKVHKLGQIKSACLEKMFV